MYGLLVLATMELIRIIASRTLKGTRINDELEYKLISRDDDFNIAVNEDTGLVCINLFKHLFILYLKIHF